MVNTIRSLLLPNALLLIKINSNVERWEKNIAKDIWFSLIPQAWKTASLGCAQVRFI